MVASGLSGPARASSGAVRDYLLGVVLLNGKGESLTFGGQVMKNVAGYDVSRLMAGTLGTLGVLLEVSLKVLPIAPAEATLACRLPQQQALDLLNRWGGQPLPLNASCWVHDDSAASGAGLIVRAPARRRGRCRGRLPAHDGRCAGRRRPATRMDNVQAGADWNACREQTLPFFARPPALDACLWRLSVPQTTSALDLPFPPLIEWHGGLRWLWAPASAAAQLRQLAAQAGGHATLFRRAAKTPAPRCRCSPRCPRCSRASSRP